MSRSHLKDASGRKVSRMCKQHPPKLPTKICPPMAYCERGIRKILTETSVPLDLPANGRPDAAPPRPPLKVGVRIPFRPSVVYQRIQLQGFPERELYHLPRALPRLKSERKDQSEPFRGQRPPA